MQNLSIIQNQYDIFKQWLLENGLIINPNIQFSFTIDNNCLMVGVAASDYINEKTVIGFIPEKLIITKSKVLNSELNIFIKQNPLLFEGDDAQLNYFIIYLIREKIKSSKSFYSPYINILLNNQYKQFSQEELNEIRDPILAQKLINSYNQIKQKLDTLFYLIQKNDQFFPGVVYEDLVWALYVVKTRLFGGSICDYSMIPFLDSFNHSSINPITYYIVNTRLEKNKEDIIYKQRKNQIDMSLIKDFVAPQQKLINNKDRYIKKHKIFLEDLQDKDQIEQINYNRLKNTNKNLWQLRFFTTSDSEDNDTDKDDKQKQLIDARDQEIQMIQNSSNKELIYEQYQFSSLSYSDYSSEDDQEWYDGQDEDNYIAVVTQIDYKKGQEIFNSYGNCSNLQLLTRYGFSLPNNKYDSYCFRIWFSPLEININLQYEKFLFRELVDKLKKQQGYFGNGDNIVMLTELSQEIKLKRS